MDANKTIVDEWDSIAEPHTIEGLKPGGTYTLRANMTSEGYTTTTETSFSINNAGEVTTTGNTTTDENGNTVLLVEIEKTKVQISCVDVRDGAELEGSTIQVLDSEGNVVEEWVSTNEAHIIEGLYVDETYTLRNTVASDGYKVTSDTTFSIDETGEVTTTGNTATDEEGNTVLLVEMQITQVQISCTDLASGEELEGSTIQVIDSEGSVVEEWTSTTEAHEVYGLKTGEEYTLSITVAPDGYMLTTDTTFTIDETGNVTSTGTISEDGILLVEIQMTHVEISCTDLASGEELEGSTIQVIDSEGNVVEEWTSTTEAHEVYGLKTGEEYTLSITVAPDGYMLTTDTTFTIDETGNVTSTGTISEDGILLVEIQMTRVQISCVDIADGEGVEGSTIQVIDSQGNTVEEWTSTTDAHAIEGLKTGEEYTLRNTVASDGYKVASDTTFSIDNAGEVTTTGNTTTDENGNTVLLVEIEKTKVQISCVDVRDGAELEGSTIQVLDQDGRVVEEWTSTTEAHQIEGLKTGETYTLRTTVASEGFILPTDTTFTIDETGHVTSTCTMPEEGILLVEIAKTQVQVLCVDVRDGEELGGSHIQVIDSEGNVAEDWYSETESHQIEGLKTGEEYTLRTTMASDGYVVPANITFTISDTGRVTTTGNTTTDENGNTLILIELTKAQVQISCTDVANGAKLEGAHIEILDEDGNVADEFDSTDTAYQIENLNTGIEYTLRTTVAPDGYTFPTNTRFTIDEAGHVRGTGTAITDENGNTVILIEFAKTIVKISSVNIGDGNEIEGVEMQIINPNAEVKDEWVSTNEPHQKEGLNINTQYNIHVMSMPANYALDTTDDLIFTIDEEGRVTTTGTITGDGVILVELRRTH